MKDIYKAIFSFSSGRNPPPKKKKKKTLTEYPGKKPRILFIFCNILSQPTVLETISELDHSIRYTITCK
jgi:hypothetical protein